MNDETRKKLRRLFASTLSASTDDWFDYDDGLGPSMNLGIAADALIDALDPEQVGPLAVEQHEFTVFRLRGIEGDEER